MQGHSKHCRAASWNCDIALLLQFLFFSFVTTFCTMVKSSDPDSAEANLSGATALEGVPMLDLGRRYEQTRGDVLAAVGPRQHYILGPDVEALELRTGGFLRGERRGGMRLARTLGGLLSRPLE